MQYVTDILYIMLLSALSSYVLILKRRTTQAEDSRSKAIEQLASAVNDLTILRKSAKGQIDELYKSLNWAHDKRKLSELAVHEMAVMLQTTANRAHALSHARRGRAGLDEIALTLQRVSDKANAYVAAELKQADDIVGAVTETMQ